MRFVTNRIHIDHKAMQMNLLEAEKPSKSLLEKVKFAAKIALSILVSALAFWTNPALFFVSFVIGIAFNNVMKKAVYKIVDFIKQHKWPVLVGCGIACALSLPVFIATASITWSIFCGSYLSTKAQEKKLQKKLDKE